MDNYVFQIIKKKENHCEKNSEGKTKTKATILSYSSILDVPKTYPGHDSTLVTRWAWAGGICLTLVGIWASPFASYVSLNLSSFSFLISKVWKIPNLPTLGFEDTMR